MQKVFADALGEVSCNRKRVRRAALVGVIKILQTKDGKKKLRMRDRSAQVVVKSQYTYSSIRGIPCCSRMRP